MLPRRSCRNCATGTSNRSSRSWICKAAGITTIIWATGYTYDYGLVKMPVFDGDGFPIQTRGVTEPAGPLFRRDALDAVAEDGRPGRCRRMCRAHRLPHRRGGCGSSARTMPATSTPTAAAQPRSRVNSRRRPPIRQLVVSVPTVVCAGKELAMPTTTVNGVRLFYTLTGDAGPPLVLVHGSWADHSDWELAGTRLRRAVPRPHLRPPRSQPERTPARARERRRGRGRPGGLDRALESRSRAYRGSLARGLHRPPAGGAPPRPVPERERPGARRCSICSPTTPSTGRRCGKSWSSIRGGGRPPGGGRRGGRRPPIHRDRRLGPGAWDYLPPEVQQLLIGNAPTFLDETRDPEALTVDLAALATFPRPVLLTRGDQSPELVRAHRRQACHGSAARRDASLRRGRAPPDGHAPGRVRRGRHGPRSTPQPPSAGPACRRRKASSDPSGRIVRRPCDRALLGHYHSMRPSAFHHGATRGLDGPGPSRDTLAMSRCGGLDTLVMWFQ